MRPPAQESSQAAAATNSERGRRPSLQRHVPSNGYAKPLFRFKKGHFGTLEAARSLLLCVEFSADGCALAGTSDGGIVLRKDAQIRHTVRAHQGPVFSMQGLDKERVMSAVIPEAKRREWNKPVSCCSPCCCCCAPSH